MVTPRNLDPKFQNVSDEEAQKVQDDKDVTPDVTPEDVPDDRTDDDKPMLVHRVRFTDDNGIAREKETRMPQADWPAYEKEHGL